MRTLTQLTSPSLHNFKAINDTLYFSKNQGREAQLCMLALSSLGEETKPECASTGQNRFRLSFDVHPSHEKVLLVESLGAQSNIIKMQW